MVPCYIWYIYHGIHDAFMFSVIQIHDTNNRNVMKTLIPNDVIVVSQVELLCVFSGVVDHSNSSHEIHDLLPRGVVQVIPALMSSVSMNPLQPQLTAGSRLLCHALWICNRLQMCHLSGLSTGAVSLRSRTRWWWISSCRVGTHRLSVTSSDL